MTELRVYLPIEDLQPQFSAWLSSPTRARAYPPFKGQNSLIIEVAPALSIHKIADLALKALEKRSISKKTFFSRLEAGFNQSLLGWLTSISIRLACKKMGFNRPQESTGCYSNALW